MLQKFYAHRNTYFSADYPRVKLSEETDSETIFRQTGLGKSAVDKLLAEGDFQRILEIQEKFFEKPEIECTPLFGWITMEDRVGKGDGIPLIDLQPGDILVTLSTHSLGWRHGHAGIVIDEDTVLECVMIGCDSELMNAGHWSEYSNFAVLRVKGADRELGAEVAEYALENLIGIPYHLSSGFIGEKAPELEAAWFGAHCSYLVWYAWNHFGYDLDSDGGRLVSSKDLLESELVEVVQMYGDLMK